MARPPQLWARAVGVVVLFVVVAGCASTSDAEEARQQQRAEELVAATQAAGVAPGLTVGVAESLYGTDAAAVCEAFRGGSTTSAELILQGNTSQGRRKVITDDAVTYARLVVETYCPDVGPAFEREVRTIDPFDTDA